MSYTAAIILGAAVLMAQAPNPGTPESSVSLPPALRLFLGLTDGQVRLIHDKNLEFNGLVAEKRRRLDQLRAEIAEETRKEALDPSALGLRYAEIEQIRREISAAEQRLRNELRNALTSEQLSKLAALEQVRELLPVYREAAALHLVAVEPPSPGPAPAPTADGQGVEGRITDTQGRPVAGALVVPRSLDVPSPPIPEIAIVSDEEGRYAWRLPPGRYEISVSAAGYRGAVKEAVVRAGQVTRLDFVLKRSA